MSYHMFLFIKCPHEKSGMHILKEARTSSAAFQTLHS